MILLFCPFCSIMHFSNMLRKREVEKYFKDFLKSINYESMFVKLLGAFCLKVSDIDKNMCLV